MKTDLLSAPHHPAKIIPFPMTTTCPTCHRPCAESELSGCMTCGAKYCPHDKWVCACDTPVTWQSRLLNFMPHFATKNRKESL
jgi:hypothetical protein